MLTNNSDILTHNKDLSNDEIYLKKLAASINLIEGEIPQSITNLNNAISINLYANLLTGWITAGLDSVSDLEVLWVGQNQLTGIIPSFITYLDNYTVFDNSFSPPYPNAIILGYQDTSNCTEVGDVNFDFTINIQDIINLVSFIMNLDLPDNQETIASDINMDGALDVLDVVAMVDYILNQSLN